MSEKVRSRSGSSSSSLADTEDDQTIARILAEDENLKAENKLAKRLSHLDSIPVNIFYSSKYYYFAFIFFFSCECLSC